VQAVLKEIGADERPVLEVYNKIDLLEGSRVSIATRTASHARLAQCPRRQRLRCAAGGACRAPGRRSARGGGFTRPDQSRLRAALYELGAVRTSALPEDGCATCRFACRALTGID
jgi:GTP-binding protein HflX